MGGRANRVDLLVNNEIMQGIEEKIHRLLNDQLSDAERKEVREWCETSEENQLFFNEQKSLHELSFTDCQSFEPDVEHAWSCVTERLFSNRKQISSWNLAYRFAAIFVLAVGLGFLVIPFLDSEELVSYKTNKNEIHKITLPDNSVVVLNENSSIRYPEKFNADSRIIYFNGQGYFDIQHDDDKPFKVIGHSAITEVLGTSFDLLSSKSRIQLNVLTGSVSIKSKKTGERKIVDHNQRAIITRSQFSVHEGLDADMLSWNFDDLSFQSTPLSEVVEVLAQYYQVKFELKGEVGSCLITSKFEGKSLEETLQILSLIASIEWTKKENQMIVLSGLGCKTNG